LTIRSQNTYHLAMEKEMPKIQVIHPDSGQILFECSLDESKRAYEMAAQMEQMGVDVMVKGPNIAETLCHSLGLGTSDLEAYKEELEEEMQQHEGSCCFSDDHLKTNT
jgi:hypothetical protein